MEALPVLAEGLSPKEIVKELDRYIIGQQEAKRSVAIALRNRYRRKKLPPDLRNEVLPKNIIMIGPTGIGKTEIARRLAKLADAPFIKVEATKFTEVGYVGRDVEAMVRDLVEVSIQIVRKEKIRTVSEKAAVFTEKKIVELLAPLPQHRYRETNPLSLFFSDSAQKNTISPEDKSRYQEQMRLAKKEQELVRERLAKGEMEEKLLEIEIEDRKPSVLEFFSGQGMEEMGVNMQDLFGNLLPGKKKRKKVTVKQARKILRHDEEEKLIDKDEVINEAIERAEQFGIIFLDEIDKIAGKNASYGPDVSREGVQRDILPLVEGSTVATKYGPVKTDHVLFIAAGAFHTSKPSDLIPELQGRFPIRVELNSLTEEDFKSILIEPENALIKQYVALLGTEGIEVQFAKGGIEKIAHIACAVNEEVENIGARRLHTILEKVLEEISFDAPDLKKRKIIIDAAYVENKLQHIVKNKDLSKYIL